MRHRYGSRLRRWSISHSIARHNPAVRSPCTHERIAIMVVGQRSLRSIYTATHRDPARALIGRQLLHSVILQLAILQNLTSAHATVAGHVRHPQRLLLLPLTTAIGGGRRRGYCSIELRFGRRARCSSLRPFAPAHLGNEPSFPEAYPLLRLQSPISSAPGRAGTRAPSSDPRRGAALPRQPSPCSWEPSAATCVGHLLAVDWAPEPPGSNPHRLAHPHPARRQAGEQEQGVRRPDPQHCLWSRARKQLDSAARTVSDTRWRARGAPRLVASPRSPHPPPPAAPISDAAAPAVGGT